MVGGLALSPHPPLQTQEPDHKGPGSISYPATPPSQAYTRRAVTLPLPLKREQGRLKVRVHRRRCVPPASRSLLSSPSFPRGLPAGSLGHRATTTPPLGTAVSGDPACTRLPSQAQGVGGHRWLASAARICYASERAKDALAHSHVEQLLETLGEPL